MKKIQLLITSLLITTTPVLLGSTNGIDFTVEQTPPNQLLILNGHDFGLSGPLSITGEYSQEYGPVLKAGYSQILNDSNVLALLFDAGSKEYRAGFTYGHRFTPAQRLKFTFEHLAQNKDFDFITGSIDEWTHQNAFGLDYQFIRPEKKLNSVDVSAYYAKANNKDLKTIDYTVDTTVKENIRRIAGATSKGATINAGFKPSYANLINVMLHYDDVDYDTKYNTSSTHYSGLGGTINYEQLLSDCLKIGLLGSLRKPYDLYQIEIAWLAYPYLDSQFELSLEGSHLSGHHGIDNDNRLGFNLTYRWGINFNKKERKFELGAGSDTQELAEWTSKPAVHFDEVLAIADETSIDKVTSENTKDATHPDTPIIKKSIEPQHGYEGEVFPTLLVNKYDLFTNPIPSRGAMTLKVTGLPNGLTFIPDEQQRPTLYHADKIEGTPAIGSDGEYTVTVTAHNEMGDTSQTFQMTIGGQGGIPIIDPIADQNFKEKVFFKLPIKIYSDPKKGDLQVTVTGLPQGVAYNANDKAIEGTPADGTAASSPYTVTVKAHNNSGDAKSRTFKLSIYTSGVPVIEPVSDQTATEKKAFKLPLTILSDPKEGTLHVTVNGLPNGLKYNATTHVIEGTPVEGSSSSSPYVITINASNDSGSATAKFNLKVLLGIFPVYLTCPPIKMFEGQAKVNIDVYDSVNKPHNFNNDNHEDGHGASYRVAKTILNPSSGTYQCFYEDAEAHPTPTIILETHLSNVSDIQYEQRIGSANCYPRPSFYNDCRIEFKE